MIEILSEAQIAERVEATAARIAPTIDNETVVVCLLMGGLWFAADLTRALARLGRDTRFDALWPSSYADGRESLGQVALHAGLQRPLDGRGVLLVDDVFDSGRSLAHAAGLVKSAGAGRVRCAVFARKPWAGPRAMEPDFVAWEAPATFLVGYGMDDAGRHRGRPGVAGAE